MSEGRLLNALAEGASVQEFDRVLNTVDASLGTDGSRVPIDGLARFVALENGYEDKEEVEDALQMPFHHFISTLPHVSVTDSHAYANALAISSSSQGQSKRQPVEICVTVRSVHDLDTIVVRSAYSHTIIDAAEVQMKPDGLRRIDTVRGHVSSAAEDLRMSDVLATAFKLEQLLEVHTLWTMIVHDDSGFSEVESGRDNAHLAQLDASHSCSAPSGDGIQPRLSE